MHSDEVPDFHDCKHGIIWPAKARLDPSFGIEDRTIEHKKRQAPQHSTELT